MLHSSSWLCSQEDGDWSKELIDLCWEFVVNSFPSEDPFCKDSFCLKWGHRIKRKKVVPTTVFFFLPKCKMMRIQERIHAAIDAKGTPTQVKTAKK